MPRSPSSDRDPTPADRRWALIVLVAISTVAFIDRSILNTVGQAIKDDLKVSDLQLGLLGGAAFAVLYGLLAIPVARLAEHRSRVAIISIAVAVWSAMTALSGFANSFTHLLLARIGVGVGEAGAGAPSQSLLSDYYPPEKRASVFSILGLATPLGIIIGGLGGAVVAQQFGWRAAFLIVGAPGLVIALIAWLTLKEPPRGFSEGRRDQGAPPPLSAVLTRLGASRTFRHFLIAAVIINFVGFSGMSFLHPFLVRTFNVDYTTAAFAFVIVNSISLAGGYLAGGFITDRLVKRDLRWYAWAPAIGMALAAPAYIAGFLQTQWIAAILVLILPGLFSGVYFGPTFAVTHNLVEPRMRASATALLSVVMSLVGMTTGPVVTGWLSDLFAARAFTLGDYAACSADGGAADLTEACRVASAVGIRNALVVIVTLFWWASLHYLLAARSIRAELQSKPA
ncbi:MAG: MFS transporter [Alphaproteobacteria bacterium]|nr:MFS transporter [Alphaproteobacteria bacterium]MBU1515542.1 MFS transporter [Alphaproteobacteria bacterium]MBU2095540.1 MFS transporter [Alphaproteobacteria bacterium]MBU2150781.1 MFS transporter [Alphaproteobacteria bacterium]MBU2307046.1 MFS transporter [Alphaproteobacteria bacterium]